MLNKHELFILFVIQVSTIFSVQNVFLIFGNYGHQFTENSLDANKTVNSNFFYRYNNTVKFYSMYNQWADDGKLYYLWNYVIMIQQIGIFIGSVAFGFISDYIGRKNVCQYVLLFSSLILLIEGFLSSPTLVMLCQFFIGTQAGAVLVVSWSLATELLSTKTRFLARAFTNWPNGKLILVLICYLSANWRISLHVFSGISFFIALIYIFLVPESPTWLHCHGEREKALRIITDVLKKSKGKCDIVLPTGLQTKKLSFQQIWQKEKYRKLIFLFGTIWVMTNFTATMLDFSEVIIIKNDLILSQLLLAGVPSFLKIFLGTLEVYLGIISRRNLHLTSLFVSGTSMCICGFFIIFGFLETNRNLYVIFYLLGYSSIEFIWDACYLCVVEQIPTEIRGTISGVCSFLSRIAGILASQMDRIKKVWEPAPLFIAFLSAIAHFLIAFYFLEESKDANLSEVGFDLRRISKKVSQKLHRLEQKTKQKESDVTNISK